MDLYYVDGPPEGQPDSVYAVFVVPTGERARFERQFPRLVRLRRERAVELGYELPRRKRAEGQGWPGGFWGLTDADDIEEAIGLCRRATMELIDEMEGAGAVG
jgi:hypothetical protein